MLLVAGFVLVMWGFVGLIVVWCCSLGLVSGLLGVLFDY